jgi:MFS family permease
MTNPGPVANGGTEFTPAERRAVLGLTALFTLRMLGFYLVLPVLSTYARDLPGSTPVLAGMSVGVYGLTQLIFQLPFGTLSDRWGRRVVLSLGLLLFAVGSVICALAATAWALVLGRTVQGTGVLASVLVATIADLTRDQVRTRAMVWIGISIGIAFATGLLLGPVAAERVGVPALFWLTAILTTLGIVYLWVGLPAPPRVVHHEDLEYSKEHLSEVLFNRQLLRLDYGIFNLHLSLTAIFVTVPFLLRNFFPLGHQYRLFLPLLAVGMGSMLMGGRVAERPRGPRRAALAGHLLLIGGLSAIALSAPASARDPRVGITTLVLGLFLFISAFALLEPLFPALLTRACQQANRGTAAGVFNMSQMSGAFVGGLVSGLLLDSNLEVLFWILAGAGVLGLATAWRLHDPMALVALRLPIAASSKEEQRSVVKRLLALPGVEDVAWEQDRRALLVRYEAESVDASRLREEAGPPPSTGTD